MILLFDWLIFSLSSGAHMLVPFRATLPKFNSSPPKSCRDPIGKDHLPTTMAFRGNSLLNFVGVSPFIWEIIFKPAWGKGYVSSREGSSLEGYTFDSVFFITIGCRVSP